MPKIATLEARRALQVDGQQNYTNNGIFRLRFNDVDPLEHGETYVRAIELAIDVTFSNAGGAPALLPELLIPRIVDSIQHRSSDGWPFFQLPEQAGRALVIWDWWKNGRYPEVTQVGQGNTLSIPAGGTAVARLKLTIPFTWEEGIEPDDINVALRDLRNTQIECRWANADVGGIFDSGANDESATAATVVREATAVLVARDEYRVAPYPSLVQETLSGIEEDIALNDVRFHALAELALQADGITESFITDVQRDRVRLRVGNLTLIDRVDAKDLVTSFNRTQIREAASRLPQMEANTNTFVPILFAQRTPRKVTHSPLVQGLQPRIRVEGDGTISQPTYLHFSTRLNKLPIVTQTMRRAKVPVNPEFLAGAEGAARQLEPKTVSKVGVNPGATGIQSMPIKHSPRGDRRNA